MNTEKNSPLKTAKEAGASIRQKIFGYIAAGFGLVAGLAWNDAIKSLIEYLIPSSGNTVIAKAVYALVLTLFVGLFLFYLEKIISHSRNKQ